MPIEQKRKSAALKEIRNRLDDRLHDMNNNIAIKVNEMKEQKCGTARQQLRDERARLAEIERNLSDNNFNATQRTEYFKGIALCRNRSKLQICRTEK